MFDLVVCVYVPKPVSESDVTCSYPLVMNRYSYLHSWLFCHVLLVYISAIHCHTAYTIWQEENKVSAVIQESEVRNLVERLLGNRSSEFLVTVNPSMRTSTGHNQAVIESHVESGVTVVHIVGSTGVSVAWGLHHYLKYYCLAHISWETDQLDLPGNLPEVELTLTSNDLYR